MQQSQHPQQSHEENGFYCQGCLEEAYQQAGLAYTWLPSLEDEPCPRHIHDPRRRSSPKFHQPSESQEQRPPLEQELPLERLPQLAEGLALGRSLAELLSVETRPTSPIYPAGTPTPSGPKWNPIHQAAVEFPVTGELDQAHLRQPTTPTAAVRSTPCPRCQGSGVRTIDQQHKRCWYCGGRGQVSPEEHHSAERAEGTSLEQEQALEYAYHEIRDTILRITKEVEETEQTLRLVVGHAKMGTRKLRLLAALQRAQSIREAMKDLAGDLSSEEGT